MTNYTNEPQPYGGQDQANAYQQQYQQQYQGQMSQQPAGDYYQQQGYAQQQAYYQPQQPAYAHPQVAMGGGAPASAAPIDPFAAAQVYQAQNRAVMMTYLQMGIALLVTAFTAMAMNMSGVLDSMLTTSNGSGLLLLTVVSCIVEVILVIAIQKRAMSLKKSAAATLLYLFAFVNGLSFSLLFECFSITSIGIVFAICSLYYFALSMLAVTTHKNLLGLGSILFTGLIMLLLAEVVVFFVFPGNTANMIIAAVSVAIFSFYTAYDTQMMRATFEKIGPNPQVLDALSVSFALDFYLDFINLFIYLLRLFGSRN